jgi:hypothetical protein
VAEDPRIALIKQAFADFEARNVAGLAGFLHPEVESHVAPSLLNSGRWHGPSGFVEMVQGWEDVWGEITYTLGEIELIDARNVIVHSHQEATGAGSGVPVANDVVYLVEIEGEQAIRFEIHSDREGALAAI